MKTYVLIVSKTFPKYHQLAGDNTEFANLIRDAILTKNLFAKRHTMRFNYDLWKKRFDEINNGKAQLSVREWNGKPYASKQEVIFNLTKKDGIGLEKAQFTRLGWFINDIESDVSFHDFAKNDGLSKGDWYNWFNDSIHVDMEPLAIIHFTPFRYGV